MKLHTRMITFRLAWAFIACFFVIFDINVLLEVSAHKTLPSYTWYLAHLSLRAELFIPLSLAWATVYVFYKMQTQQETLALFSSGVSRSQILIPLHILVAFTTTLQTINYTFFTHDAMLHLYHQRAYAAQWEEDQPMFFQKRDHAYKNIFWIHKDADIWHAQSATGQIATNVDHFVIHGAEIQHTSHVDECPLPQHTTITDRTLRQEATQMFWLAAPLLLVYPFAIGLLSYRKRRSLFTLMMLQLTLFFCGFFVCKALMAYAY